MTGLLEMRPGRIAPVRDEPGVPFRPFAGAGWLQLDLARLGRRGEKPDLRECLRPRVGYDCACTRPVFAMAPPGVTGSREAKSAGLPFLGVSSFWSGNIKV